MQRSKASTFNFSTSSYFRASMARIFLIRKREELHSFTALFCTKASFYKFPFIQTPFFCVTISHTLVHNHKPWKIWPCRARYFFPFSLWRTFEDVFRKAMTFLNHPKTFLLFFSFIYFWVQRHVLLSLPASQTLSPPQLLLKWEVTHSLSPEWPLLIKTDIKITLFLSVLSPAVSARPLSPLSSQTHMSCIALKL